MMYAREEKDLAPVQFVQLSQARSGHLYRADTLGET